MLYDEHLEYSVISKEEFESNLELVSDNEAKIVNSIIIFCKNKKSNEIKKFIYNDEKNDLFYYDSNNWEILVKYYIKYIKVFNPYKFHFQEIGSACYIYKLGYFYISDFYKDFKPSKNEKIYNIFTEYDRNYHNIEIPFTDEEFLSSKWNFK